MILTASAHAQLRISRAREILNDRSDARGARLRQRPATEQCRPSVRPVIQPAEVASRLLRGRHPDQDTRVPYRRTTEMIEAIRQVGGHPKMTIFPNVGHDSWGLAYGDPAVLAWLFAQKK